MNKVFLSRRLLSITLCIFMIFLLSCDGKIDNPQISSSSSSSITQSPSIEFTSIPPYYAPPGQQVSGRISNVNFAEYRIAVYIFLGSWYNKASWAEPLTVINPDGTWTCELGSNISDTLFTEIRAYLVKSNVTPPLLGATNIVIPADFIQQTDAVASFSRYPSRRTIEFSGFTWYVKSSEYKLGPGPNYFSDAVDAVWVDAEGLHLTIKKSGTNWYCTEVCMTNKGFGYGKYMFEVKSRVDRIDTNANLGLFMFDYSAANPYREFDFEFMHWRGGAIPSNHNASFVVQPYGNSGNLRTFIIDLTGTNQETTHAASWSGSGIDFVSLNNVGYDISNVFSLPGSITNWLYSGDDVPSAGNEQVHINFWLPYIVADGDSLGTASGTNVEIVIKNFEFSE